MYIRRAGWFSLILSALFMVSGLAVLVSYSPSAAPLSEREPFTDTACLDCHTDQAQLEEITAANEANEPEEASLSSGPG